MKAKKENVVRCIWWMTPSIKAAIKKEAKKVGVSESEIVRRTLQSGITK